MTFGPAISADEEQGRNMGGLESLGVSERGIVEDHIKMARTAARRFACRVGLPAQYEEFKSAAFEAICDAAAAYDPGRGVTFPAFARRRIFGAMADLAGWLRCRPRGRAGEPLEFGDVPDRPMDDDGPARADLIAEAEAFIRGLPAHLRPLARLLILDGLSQAEAAREIGCTRGYVCRLHRQIEGYIRRFAA